MTSDRLDDLETRLMYQEQMIEELNAVITKQNLELAGIIQKLGKIQGDVEQLQPLLMTKSMDEPPPPHY